MPTSIATRGEDNGDAAVLVEYSLRQVARDRRLVVRVWRDDENVGLEPFVRWRIGGRLLRSGNRSQRYDQMQTDQRHRTSQRSHSAFSRMVGFGSNTPATRATRNAGRAVMNGQATRARSHTGRIAALIDRE